jgi:hypothetical protein
MRIPRRGPTFRDVWGNGDGQLLDMTFSPDGRTLALAEDRGVELWSLEPKDR